MIILQLGQAVFVIIEALLFIVYMYFIMKIKKAEAISGLKIPQVWHRISIFNLLFILLSIFIIAFLRFE